MSGKGWLKNGNPAGDFRKAPRCGAKNRRGLACQQPGMANGRCRLHGGKSTGARTPEGRQRIAQANLKHGYYAKAARQLLHLRPLPTRLWDLFRRVKPVFEARLAESRVVVRNQRPLAHLDTVVARVRVRDYLAWILARSQVPSDEFIQTKLFGTSYFHGGIHR